MAIDLLSEEVKEDEFIAQNSLFTLTNKRLIFYDSDLNINRFIGINELRSAEVSSISVNYQKFKINDPKKLAYAIAFIICISIGLYYAITSHKTGGEFILMVLFCAFIMSAAGGVIGFVISGLIVWYSKITSKNVQRVKVTVMKKDNSFFLNHHYDIRNVDELKRLSYKINNQIYKS